MNVDDDHDIDVDDHDDDHDVDGHDHDLPFQCQDYEKYLAEIGTGPLSRVMVMRASVVVNITQVLIKMLNSVFLDMIKK